MNTISYGRQYIDRDDIDAVVEALKSDNLTQGPKVAEFEQALCEYNNCRYAVVFANGTAALHGAYFASGIKQGEEFITTPITFAASANAGIYMGAVPVLCDIDEKSWNIDIEKIEEKITQKTRVITPVSYAGNLVDLKKIKEIADRRGIVVIHDAAHALGAVRDGYGIAEFCDMAMVSFHPVKHITTGEGGVILTDNEYFYKRLLLFRSHGITKDKNLLKYGDEPWYYEMHELGYNYRITDIQCALGVSQLKKADYFIKRRNEIAEIYYSAFKNSRKFSVFENYRDKNTVHAFHLYPVLLKDAETRKRFFNYMRDKNIWVQVHYIPLNYMPYYQDNFCFKRGDMPVAERFYERETSIPMYPAMTDEEIKYVIAAMNNFE